MYHYPAFWSKAFLPIVYLYDGSFVYVKWGDFSFAVEKYGCAMLGQYSTNCAYTENDATRSDALRCDTM